MIPSRGLPPVRRVQFASRNAVRQFSSIPRNGALSARAAPAWQTGPRRLNTPTVRHASWYAPWTWGTSSTPTPAPPAASNPTPTTTQSVQELAQEPAVAASAQDIAAPAQNEAIHATQTATSQVAPGARSFEDVVDAALAEELPFSQPVAETGGTAITQYGALKEMGLDFGWGSSAFFEWLIEHVYLDTGLGWGASIAIATVIIRVGLFGFQFKGSDNMARMAAVQPLVQDINEEMKKAIQAQDVTKNGPLRAEQARIYKSVGASPFRTLYPVIVQGVLGFGAFRCLRNMSTLPAPEMSQGGWLWFQDLTMSDPYYLLPLISGGIMYISVRLGGETGANNQTMAEGMKKVVQVVFPVFMTLISAFQPASLQIYLACTAFLSAITATILRNKPFRKLTGLAPLPTPEAQALWKKVAKGEISIDQVIDKSGRLKVITAQTLGAPVYQAPSKYSNTTQVRGLNVAKGTVIPAHLKKSAAGTGTGAVSKDEAQLQDRDYDYDTPPKGMVNKVDWIGRNYNPTFVWRRMRGVVGEVTRSETVQSEMDRVREKVRRKQALKEKERHEARRRERFGQK